MHKLIVMYPQPDDPEQFMEYYVSVHVPLASQLPGLISSSYGRPTLLGAGEPVFLIWEGVFSDKSSLVAALKSDAGARVAADVPNYSKKGAVMMQCEVVES